MVEWIVSSSVLILIVTLLQFLLKGKIALRLQYALWALVLVRLLVPVSFGQSSLSVYSNYSIFTLRKSGENYFIQSFRPIQSNP